MAVSAQHPVIEYTANGSSTVFSFPFLISSISDFSVYFNSIRQASGFTVSGLGIDTGGSVTFAVPPANGVIVKILRTMTLERTTDYVEGGALRSEVLDNDLDRMWQALQGIRADAASLVEFEALNGLISENIEEIENNRVAAESAAAAASGSESAASSSASSALSYANTSSTQAGVATTQAGIAATQASNAGAAATTATAQAGVATTQASNAGAAATTATAQAGVATTQAGNASASATTATTQAGNASSSAAAAAASALDAENRVPKTSNTGSAVMPVGTSAQRDAVPISGYTRFNTTLQSLEVYNDAALAWVPAGQGATGAVGNPVFYENDKVITGDYTVPSNKNAMSAGPIEINPGVVVTLAGDALWRIV